MESNYGSKLLLWGRFFENFEKSVSRLMIYFYNGKRATKYEIKNISLKQ
jgi:hypothetical protein